MESPTATWNLARATALRPLALVCGLVALTACAARPPAPAAVPAQPDTLTLVLMGTTDVHGRLYNHDYYTGRETEHGLAVLKPLVDSIRGIHAKRALLFDSGDLLQGNPLGFVYARQHAADPNPIIRAMNLLKYDAAAVGNHEFNYGLDHLRRAIDLAEFPFVSANIFDAGTERHAYVPWVLLPIVTPRGDTLRVGVTGNTPPGVHVWDRDNVTGILELRDVVSSVREVVRRMRAAGADVVVVLSHGGLEGTSYDTVTTGLPAENAAAELARQEPDIDVIFLGHTHRELADTTINGVLLTQARNWAASLAVATLHVARGGDGWEVVRKAGEILRPAPGRVDRPFMDSLRWEHERTVAYVNARIGAATEAMPAREGRVRDTPVIDFINEVQRRVSGADLSSTAAFQIDAGLPAGDISIADVAALYPYDNTLKAIRITGAQLRGYLEKSAEYYAGFPAPAGGAVTNFSVPGYNFDIVSGVDYTIDISRPVGQRITSLARNGTPVSDGDTFTLALNNYRQSGGGGYDMIAGAEVVYDRQEDIRELLIDEIRARGIIRPEDWFRENWRIVPAQAADAALAEQVARDIRGGTAATEPRRRLRVLTTNDFHGNLDPIRTPTGTIGGAAALATYFRMEREGFGTSGPVLLLDGGDVMQGTPVSTLLRGRSTVAYYNAAGYDAAAIGNHEFDWGPDTLRVRKAEARFPWLAANILVAGTDTTPSWIRGTAVLERDGMRIGILGLMTEELPEATMAQHIEGLEVADGADVMNRLVPRLRAQNVDFVIVVAHAGARCSADMSDCGDEMVDWLSRTREKPDLVVAGHTHEVVRTRVNGITLIESGRWGTHYGVVDLERVTADSVDAWIRGTPVPWTERVPADPAVAALVAAAHEEAGPRLSERVATAAEEIPRGAGEHPLGRLIADAQRAATGAQIAFMNSGGVRAPINAGPVTWGDLFRVQPFGNMLVVLELRGADVKAALEHALAEDGGMRAFVSGMTAVYDPARAAGDRVVAMHLADGQPIEPDRVYTVSVPDFLASGVGDGFAAFGRSLSQTHTGIVDLDALITYIRQQAAPIRSPHDVRVRAVDAAP